MSLPRKAGTTFASLGFLHSLYGFVDYQPMHKSFHARGLRAQRLGPSQLLLLSTSRIDGKLFE